MIRKNPDAPKNPGPAPPAEADGNCTCPRRTGCSLQQVLSRGWATQIHTWRAQSGKIFSRVHLYLVAQSQSPSHTQRSRWTAPAAAHGDSLTWRTLGVVSPGVPPKACHAVVVGVGERLACASRRRVGQGRHRAHAHGLPPGDSRARQGRPGAGLRRGLAGRPRARRMDLAWAAARARARGGARRTGGTRLPVGATAGRALPHVCCWIHLSTDETTSPVHLCAARGSSRWARVMTEGCWSRRISLTHGCQPCSVATGR